MVIRRNMMKIRVRAKFGLNHFRLTSKKAGRKKYNQPGKRKKENISAGRGIEGLEEDSCNNDPQESDSAEPQPCSSTQAQERVAKRPRRKHS